MNAKNFLLSITYLIVAIFFLGIINQLIYYLLDTAIMPLLDWFNHLKTWIKILGGLFFGAIIISLLSIVPSIANVVGGIVFDRIHAGRFAINTAVILAYANAVWNTILLWRLPTHYGVWIVIELLLLTGFVWSFCMAVVPMRLQQQEQ